MYVVCTLDVHTIIIIICIKFVIKYADLCNYALASMRRTIDAQYTGETVAAFLYSHELNEASD